MGWFSKKANKSELSLSIEKLASIPSVENQRNFAKVISSYVEKGTWVPIPIHQDEKGYRLKITENESFTVPYGTAIVRVDHDKFEIDVPGKEILIAKRSR